ncbi:MAG: hypothetical protein JW819_13395, partial [Candidatus Krumholzibacteriota bacterium]|nr:hypothetical protein [Candidatus Krumholzibacteriota bacterium]
MRIRALPILGACLSLLAAATALASTIDIPVGERTTLTLLEQRDDALRFRATVGEVLATTVSTPGGDFVRLELPGFHSSKRIGEPELPMMNRLFEIPFGAEVRVRVLNLRTREIDLAAAGVTLPVLPAQPSVSKSADPATLPFHFEAARYQEDSYFGAEYVRTEDMGRLRAVRLGRAEVAPVRYNPVAGRLIVAEEIEFELTFPGADHARGDWLKAATRSAFFEPVYGKVAGYRGLHDSYPDL